MKRYIHILVFCLLATLAFGLLPSPVVAGEGSPEEIAAQLARVGLRIERQIEVARHNVETGRVDKDMLQRWARDATAALDHLEHNLRRLAEGQAEPLRAKLVSVRVQARNLARAAQLEGAPPRPSRSDVPAKHIGRLRGPAESGPGNDDCDMAYPIGFGTFAGNTTAATSDGEASCGSSINTPDVWYSFLSPSNGLVVIETVGSSFDTVLSVHSGCPGSVGNEIECNDDYHGLQSAISFVGYAGTSYLVRVSGFNGATGSYVLTVATGGTIQGSVVETGTGDPVRVRVDTFDGEGYRLGFGYTDIAGEYQVGGLATETYFVATDNWGGLLDELYDNHPCSYPAGCDVTTGDPVAVTAGSATGGISFVLDRTGGISGFVRDEQSLQGIRYARVRVYDSDGLLGSVSTAPDGAFTVNGLPAGTYFVATTVSTHGDEAWDDIPCPGGPPSGCDVTQATPIEVELNSTTTGIDFELSRLGAITGVVIDRTGGLPLSDAIVQVYDHGGSFLAGASCGSDGSYELGGLADGTYFVQALNWGHYVDQLYRSIDCPPSGCDLLTGTPLVIVNQSTVSGIDFDLVAKGSITGTVTDSTMTASVGVNVQIYSQAGSLVDYALTDSSGQYTVEDLDAGSYFAATNDRDYNNELYDGIGCADGCDPTTGTPIAVVNATSTGGIDFHIVKKGCITGSVVEQAGSLPINVLVKLFESDGTFVGHGSSYAGQYEITGLDSGSYFVVADNRSGSHRYMGELYDDIPCTGGPPDGCDVTTGTPVSVEVATVTSGIDFALNRSGSISGVVVDAIDQSSLSGYIYIKEIGGDGFWTEYSHGSYTLEGLLPGSYLVIADIANYVDEVWDDQPCAGEYPEHCDISGGTPVVLEAGMEVDIDFALDRLGSLSGTVRDRDNGAPLTGFRVQSLDATGEVFGYDYSDSGGGYEIRGLWPGTRYLATSERSLSHVDQLYDGIDCPGGPPYGCDPTAGDPLAIGIGTSLNGLDFNLGRTGTIEGRVTDASTGQPLSGVNVELWDADGDFVRSDSSDHNGMYEVIGLAPGSFYVATDEYGSSNPDYIDQLYDAILCLGGPPNGCDPTKGTPVSVTLGQTVRFVDFALTPRRSGVRGSVSDVVTGEPIPAIRIDFWDFSSGTFELSTTTTMAGTYVGHLDPGTYVCATDNADDWVNQIWQEIECFGSPFNGDCDPMIGAPIEVLGDELTEGIDFSLALESLFVDGFESGDTTAWQ